MHFMLDFFAAFNVFAVQKPILYFKFMQSSQGAFMQKTT